jgi:hypothetical protein
MARYHSGHDTTRELLFDDRPFTWIPGDEFTEAGLFPDVVEDESAALPGFISLVAETSIDSKKKRTKEQLLEEQRRREAGEILLLVEHPWCANEVTVEELADPDFIDPFDGPPEPFLAKPSHDLTKYRRVVCASGQVALLPMHA